jgi:glutamine amidotransferase PdxT
MDIAIKNNQFNGANPIKYKPNGEKTGWKTSQAYFIGAPEIAQMGETVKPIAKTSDGGIVAAEQKTSKGGTLIASSIHDHIIPQRLLTEMKRNEGNQYLEELFQQIATSYHCEAKIA